MDYLQQMVNIQRLKDIRYFAPRRVKQYLLIGCSAGSVTLQVDDKELLIKENEVLTITSGQYHYFRNVKDAEGYLLDFTLDFVCKNDNDIELIFQNSLFCHFDYNEIIPIANPTSIMHHLTRIAEELEEKPFQYLTSVHARIELILVEINRAKIAHGHEIWKPAALFLRFLEFVRNNFESNYTLAEISDHLQTTELKLNQLARQHVGKTAQNVIYGLIISEAKRIIQYEDLLMKEVAFKLGFDDPFYFSKFFKNHMGISPSDYRDSLKS